MGVWNRGSEVVGPRMYPQFVQCWGDCVVNPMGLLGEMHFRIVHPGDGRAPICLLVPAPPLSRVAHGS